MVFFYNVVVLVIAAVTCVNSVIQSNQMLEKQVLSCFEKWREGGIQSNLFPFPPIDVVYIKPIATYYDQRGIKITFTIGDMELRGLDNFTVDFLKTEEGIDDFLLTMKFFVPVLNLSSESYTLQGRAYFLYPLKGSGKMSILFHNVDILFSLNFANIGNVKTIIDVFSLKFDIGSIYVDLKHSSWPINPVLNKEGVQMLSDYHEDIASMIESEIVPYVNKRLTNCSLEQFMKKLSDIGDNSYVISKNI